MRFLKLTILIAFALQIPSSLAIEPECVEASQDIPNQLRAIARPFQDAPTSDLRLYQLDPSIAKRGGYKIHFLQDILVFAPHQVVYLQDGKVFQQVHSGQINFTQPYCYILTDRNQGNEIKIKKNSDARIWFSTIMRNAVQISLLKRNGPISLTCVNGAQAYGEDIKVADLMTAVTSPQNGSALLEVTHSIFGYAPPRMQCRDGQQLKQQGENLKCVRIRKD